LAVLYKITANNKNGGKRPVEFDIADDHKSTKSQI
jgi:hypothetical protein